MAGRTKGPRFYATKRSATDFATDIMQLLDDFGAGSYMVQREEGRTVAISFQMGGLAYRIRPNVRGVRERLEKHNLNRAEPEAVAWAQARHLLELQLEAIQSGAGRASEVLGGYVLTSQGRTVGDMLDERTPELMPGEQLLLPKGAP